MKGVLGAVLLAVALMGCASTESVDRVEKRIQSQSGSGSMGQPGMIAAKGHNVFLSAPGLTEAEKAKLLEVHQKTFIETEKIKNEIGKLKAALFETLIDQKSSRQEVALLKEKIVKLDKRKLDLMMRALDDVMLIVGKNKEVMQYYRDSFLKEYRGQDTH